MYISLAHWDDLGHGCHICGHRDSHYVEFTNMCFTFMCNKCETQSSFMLPDNDGKLGLAIISSDNENYHNGCLFIGGEVECT